MFKKGCPHCNDPKLLFLASEFNKKNKMRECTVCGKKFTVVTDYKKFALVGIPVLVGVAALGVLIFGESPVASIAAALSGGLIGYASATTLEAEAEAEA